MDPDSKYASFQVWRTAQGHCHARMQSILVFMYPSLGSAYGSQPVMDLLRTRIDRDQYT